MEKSKILIIDGNKPFAWALKRSLNDISEYDILSNIGPEEVLTYLKGNPPYNALIMNFESKEDITGKTGSNILEEIRLHEDNKLWGIPVILLSFRDLISLLKKDPQKNLLFISDGCSLLKLPLNMLGLFNILNKIRPLKDKHVIYKYISLAWGKELIDEKHGIANEFGAIKLAEGAWLAGEITEKQYNELKEQIEHEILPEMRRAIKRYEIGVVSNGEKQIISSETKIIKQSYKSKNELQGKRILLIDDNWEKGWNIVLSSLFNPSLICEESAEEAKKHLNLNDYLIDKDLILLDARLSSEDKELKGPGVDYTNLSSWKLLKKIRESDPSIPIILFTASERFDIYRKFQMIGISDIFVKELPGCSSEYTKNNFIHLRDIAMKAISNAKKIRPIWKRIAKLSKDKRVKKEIKESLKKAFYFLTFLEFDPTEKEASLLRIYAESIVHLQISIENIVDNKYENMHKKGDLYPN